LRLFVGIGATLLFAGISLAAAAAELAPDLRALIEHFQSHRRVALGYLQANNPDLGAIALERLRSAWAADRRSLASPGTGDQALTRALAATDTAVAASLAAVDAGEPNRARTLLEHAAAPLDDWRRAHGVRLFSDCIAELNGVYRRLDAHRAKPPDLGDTKIRDEILAEAGATAAATARCDAESPSAIHGEAEFRRLIDGMTASLRQMPAAVRLRDDELLHRLLDEQRAFDRLLAFRFG